MTAINVKNKWKSHGYNFGLTTTEDCCKEPYTVNNTALAILCFGKVAHTHMCETALESIRKNGMWEGALFLLTDTPTCFENIRPPPHSFSHLSRRHNVTLSFSSNYGSTVLVFPSPKSEMDRKSYKSKLFDYIKYDNILLIDADIMTARPILPFLSRLTENPCLCFSIGLFSDQGTEGWRQPFHGAVLLLNRLFSSMCLRSWNDLIASGWYLRDQGALLELSYDVCAFKELPKDGLLLPTTEILTDHLQKGTSLPPHEQPLFVHFTKGRMRDIAPELQLSYAKQFLNLQESWTQPKTDLCQKTHSG